MLGAIRTRKEALMTTVPAAPRRRARAALGLGIAFLAASAGALADGRHGHRGPRVSFGITIGAPLHYGAWYPGPFWYYPPVAPLVIAPAAPPPVYVQREEPASARSDARTDAASWWYYCRDANAYYPYVKQCPAGWEKVAPQPPA